MYRDMSTTGLRGALSPSEQKIVVAIMHNLYYRVHRYYYTNSPHCVDPRKVSDV